MIGEVTGQLADTPTRGLPTRGLVNSRTRQLTYWTSRGCHRRLWVLSFRSFGGICETASCPVREMSSPRVGNPRVGVSASYPVTIGEVVVKFLVMVMDREELGRIMPLPGAAAPVSYTVSIQFTGRYCTLHVWFPTCRHPVGTSFLNCGLVSMDAV